MQTLGPYALTFELWTKQGYVKEHSRQQEPWMALEVTALWGEVIWPQSYNALVIKALDNTIRCCESQTVWEKQGGIEFIFSDLGIKALNYGKWVSIHTDEITGTVSEWKAILKDLQDRYCPKILPKLLKPSVSGLSLPNILYAPRIKNLY
jgi:hypothetical protein